MAVAPTPTVPSLPWEVPAPAPPAVTVVPADTATAHRLRRIASPGVVLVTRFVSDNNADLESAAAGILVGLGKDPMLAYAKRWASLITSGWLATSGIHTAVIVDPDDYSGAVRDTIVEWLAGHGVRTWFAWNAPTDGTFAPAVVARGAVEVGEAEFWSTFPTGPRPEAPEPTSSSLPRLPRVDAMAFRSACRDLLSAEDFAVVDERFRGLVAELRSTIAAHRKPYNRADLRLLRRLIDQAPDTEELILAVRAAQIAFLLQGRHVSVNSTALLGAAESLPRRGHSVSQRWWERLEAYWDPDVPAAVALHHAEVTVNELCTLTLADVEVKAPDEVAVTIERGDEPLHAELSGPAGRFVAALVVFRQTSGATPEERLFVTHRSGHIARKFAADRLLRDPAVEVEVRAHHRLDHRQASDTTWLDRYGVGLTKMFRDGK